MEAKFQKKKKKWKRNLTKNLEGESVKTQEKGLNLQRKQNYRVNHDQFEKKKNKGERWIQNVN